MVNLTTYTCIWFLLLALVDKLYTAQKVREEAMMMRLKLLNDEKEEFLKRIKKLEGDQGYVSCFLLS